MFSKKKEWIAPGWWATLDRKQKVYARRMADYLGRKASALPVERVRRYLLLCLITLGTLDILVLGSFLSNSRQNAIPFSFGQAKQMVLPPPPTPEPTADFHAFIDSLKRIPANRRVLDSLLQARPGMADTLHQLEVMLRNSQ